MAARVGRTAGLIRGEHGLQANLRRVQVMSSHLQSLGRGPVAWRALVDVRDLDCSDDRTDPRQATETRVDRHQGGFRGRRDQ